MASLFWSFSCLGLQAGEYAASATPSFPKLAAIRAEAEAGNSKSQAKLGDYYSSISDFTNAVVWYRKAAEHGETEAQFSLASCYLAGQGVAKNPSEAAKWLRVAAIQIGQSEMASSSGSRTGVPPDEPGAAAGSPSIIDAQNYSRVQRVFTVRASKPELQELPQPWRLQRAAP